MGKLRPRGLPAISGRTRLHSVIVPLSPILTHCHFCTSCLPTSHCPRWLAHCCNCSLGRRRELPWPPRCLPESSHLACLKQASESSSPNLGLGQGTSPQPRQPHSLFTWPHECFSHLSLHPLPWLLHWSSPVLCPVPTPACCLVFQHPGSPPPMAARGRFKV